MVSLREFILVQSSLPTGNTVRDHILNPGGAITILHDGVSASVDGEVAMSVTSDLVTHSTLSDSVLAEVASSNIVAEVASTEVEHEVLSDAVVMTTECSGLVTEGDVITYKVAALAVGGYRFVTVDDTGKIFHASSADTAEALQVLGITAYAGDPDDAIIVAVNGDELTEATWSWDPKKPIYIGLDGVMDQTPPTAGFALVGAIALSPTTVRVDIKTPIFL